MIKPYTIRVREFIIKITNVRLYLIRSNKSYLKDLYIQDDIKVLKEKLDYFKGVKGFYCLLARNSDKIRKIIPGKDSSSHEKFMKEYEQLLLEGSNAINN